MLHVILDGYVKQGVGFSHENSQRKRERGDAPQFHNDAYCNKIHNYNTYSVCVCIYWKHWILCDTYDTLPTGMLQLDRVINCSLMNWNYIHIDIYTSKFY